LAAARLVSVADDSQDVRSDLILMRAAVVIDLPGHFGPIEADGIWKRASYHRLDRIYFDVRQVDRHILDVCAQHHVAGGIWIEPAGWFNESLAAAALRVTRKLNDLGFTGSHAADVCPVMFDYERHSIADVVQGLQAWRKTRYKRDTVWTCEPLQGGWVGDPQLVAQIKPDTNLVVMPQTYRGPSGGLPDMRPVAQDAVRLDLLRFFDQRQVKLFYQAYCKENTVDYSLPLPEGWDGCVWDLEHMPLPPT
jgi:hypothetical protein